MSLSELGDFNSHNQPIRNTLAMGGEDDGQSTVTPLGIAGSFNFGAGDPWFDMSCWAEMLVVALADQASAINGLQIRWSHDGGANEDLTLRTNHSLLLGVQYYQAFARRARHVQVRFLNGAVAQAAFYLKTLFFATPSLGGAIGGPVAAATDFSPIEGRTENIADNLAHELSLAAGAGLDVGETYVVQPTAGEGVAVLEATVVPLVATLRAQGVVLYARQPWAFTIQVQSNRLWAVKLVDGTADTDVKCVSMSGGAGLV